MHRSGTSAMTGLLQRMGAFLGSDLMEADEYNPTGYFENNKIYRLNDEILEALQVAWDSTYHLEEDWVKSTLLKPYQSKIQDLFASEFRNQQIIGIKDPRICVLWPLWSDALTEFKLDVHCILMLRHPMEIAESLRNRDELPIEKSILLWLDHTFAVERNTRGLKRLIVFYDDLISRSTHFAASLADFIGLDAKGSLHLGDPLPLNKKLKHFYHQNIKDDQLIDVAVELWNCFHTGFDGAKLHENVDRLWLRHRQYFNLYHVIWKEFFEIKKIRGLRIAFETLKANMQDYESKNRQLNEALVTSRHEKDEMQHRLGQVIQENETYTKQIVNLENERNWAVDDARLKSIKIRDQKAALERLRQEARLRYEMINKLFDLNAARKKRDRERRGELRKAYVGIENELTNLQKELELVRRHSQNLERDFKNLLIVL